MKIFKVDEEKCIGCGACVALDSEHFDFNDEGLSNVISNSEIDEDKASDIMQVCPTSAISYVDAQDIKESCDCSCECDDECDCGDSCECDESCDCGCGGCQK